MKGSKQNEQKVLELYTMFEKVFRVVLYTNNIDTSGSGYSRHFYVFGDLHSNLNSDQKPVCKGQKHHKFSWHSGRKQIALRVWVALGLRNETIETNTFISSPEKHQFADIQVPLEWIINCKKDDSDTFHSSRKLLFIAKFTSVFYPR